MTAHNPKGIDMYGLLRLIAGAVFVLVTVGCPTDQEVQIPEDPAPPPTELPRPFDDTRGSADSSISHKTRGAE